jgi:Tol biopolymer transport system component
MNFYRKQFKSILCVKRFFLTGMIILSTGTGAVSQEQAYNHPELNWRTVETKHFFVHFHQGEDRTATRIQVLAESIYESVTSFYGYEPDEKIHFIVRDHDDHSNGAAFYYDNKIEMWASAMDFSLRGNHNWLQNVVTHEFVHMISLGAARKASRQIPAVYFQWIGYEKEKRTDVIHGYPNTIISVPFSGTIMPMWFAEGMAQTQIPGWGFDTWDTHRDMLLRTAALENKLLSMNEMGVFGKNSIGNERVYNQGFGLVLFLVERYGEKTLSQLARAMKSPFRTGFNGAVLSVLQKTESEIYREWADWISRGYQESTHHILENRVEGIACESEGSGNFFPLFSPDGKRHAFLSNRGRDYLSQTSLWISTSGTAKMVAAGVTGSFSWSPGGDKVVFARPVNNGNGSHFNDLFVYDVVKQKEKRITRSSRLRDPDWSRDGNAFVCVGEQDGTSNLFMVNRDGKKLKQITLFQNGEQIFTPRWSGNTGSIVFSISENGEGRDIAVIDSNGNGFRYVIESNYDERDPFPDPDGKHIYYASDETKIFNIRRYHVETGSSEQITNVTGGAFMPAIGSGGKLLFCVFKSDGYTISRLDSIAAIPGENAVYASPYEGIRNRLDTLNRKPKEEILPMAPSSASKPYKPIFSKLSFYPKVMMDFPRKVKIGTYFSGSDFLDKISIFGGVAVNGQLDTDLFGIFQYRFLYPTLFAEAYQIGRHTSDEEFDYSFNLMETDIGADWPISDHFSLRSVWQFSRYDAAQHFSYEGQRIKIPYTYHIGNVFSFFWTYRAGVPAVFSSISSRRGRFVDFRIDCANQRFMNGFTVHQDYGTLVELYTRHNYFQYFLDWKESFPGLSRDHGVGFRMQAGCIDRPVDSFYHFFAGGLDGLKGYPFYSISGTQMTQLSLAYRFPVLRKWGKRLSWIQFDNVFLSVYGQAGNAWTGKRLSLADWKKDVGFQLRLGLFSFYSFPLAFTFDTAYGLDRLVQEDRSYGREWRMYFGLLFDFLD